MRRKIELQISNEHKEGRYQANLCIDDTMLYPLFPPPISYREKDTFIVTFDDRVLPIPSAIARNLKLHFLAGASLFRDSKGYTCHQFANTMYGHNFNIEEIYSFKKNSRSDIAPGDYIKLFRNKDEQIHSAIYLGEGLYLSKYGQINELVITTLGIMVRDYWPCSWVGVVINIEQNADLRRFKMNTFRDFNTKFHCLSLYYMLLNVPCEEIEALRSITPKIINSALKKILLKTHSDKEKGDDFLTKLFNSMAQKLNNEISIWAYNLLLMEGQDEYSLNVMLGLDEHNTFDEITAIYKHLFKFLKDEGRSFSFLQKLYLQPLYQYAHNMQYFGEQLSSYHKVTFCLQRPKIIQDGSNSYPEYSGEYRVEKTESIQYAALQQLHLKEAQSCVFTLMELNNRDFPDLVKDLIKRGYFTVSELDEAAEILALFMVCKENFSKINHRGVFHEDIFSIKPNSLLWMKDYEGKVVARGVYLSGDFYLTSFDDGISLSLYNSDALQIYKGVANIFIVRSAWSSKMKQDVRKFLKSFDKNNAISLTQIAIKPILSPYKYLNLMRVTARGIQDNPVDGLSLMLQTSGFAQNLMPRIILDLDETVSVEEEVLSAGDYILFEKDEHIIGSAFHLGDMLFLAILIHEKTFNLRISTLTALYELLDWDRVFLQNLTTVAKDSLHISMSAISVYDYEKKPLAASLLYELLGLEYNSTNLARIITEDIEAAYEKRIAAYPLEENPIQHQAIRKAFQLLTNPVYRDCYNLKLQSGQDLGLKNFLRIEAHQDKEEIIDACIELLTSGCLKQRIIAKELPFRTKTNAGPPVSFQSIGRVSYATFFQAIETPKPMPKQTMTVQEFNQKYKGIYFITEDHDYVTYGFWKVCDRKMLECGVFYVEPKANILEETVFSLRKFNFMAKLEENIQLTVHPESHEVSAASPLQPAIRQDPEEECCFRCVVC